MHSINTTKENDRLENTETTVTTGKHVVTSLNLLVSKQLNNENCNNVLGIDLALLSEFQ